MGEKRLSISPIGLPKTETITRNDHPQTSINSYDKDKDKDKDNDNETLQQMANAVQWHTLMPGHNKNCLEFGFLTVNYQPFHIIHKPCHVFIMVPVFVFLSVTTHNATILKNNLSIFLRMSRVWMALLNVKRKSDK